MVGACLKGILQGVENKVIRAGVWLRILKIQFHLFQACTIWRKLCALYACYQES